jgi:hypothetical protein
MVLQVEGNLGSSEGLLLFIKYVTAAGEITFTN